jgi:hypothetical protein
METFERHKELKPCNMRNCKSKRSFYLSVIFVCSACICKLSFVYVNPVSENGGEIKPVILYCDNARQTPFRINSKNVRIVRLDPNESKELKLNKQDNK